MQVKFKAIGKPFRLVEQSMCYFLSKIKAAKTDEDQVWMKSLTRRIVTQETRVCFDTWRHKSFPEHIQEDFVHILNQMSQMSLRNVDPVHNYRMYEAQGFVSEVVGVRSCTRGISLAFR